MRTLKNPQEIYKKVKLLRAEGINVYDILRHEYLLFIEGALGIVEEALVR